MYYIDYVSRKSRRQFTRKFKTIDEIVKFNIAPGTSVQMITDIKSYLTPHQQQLYKSKMNTYLKKNIEKIEKIIEEEQKQERQSLEKYIVHKIYGTPRVLTAGNNLQISSNIISELSLQYDPGLALIDEDPFINYPWTTIGYDD